MLNASFGDICAIEILQATNFDVSILLIAISSISTVRPQRSPSNWTAADITTVMDKFMIKRGRNF